MFWLTIAATCLLFCLGIAVLIFNRHKHIGWLYFSFAFIVGIWLICNAAAINAVNDEASLLFVRLVMVITAPLFPILYMLALIYPNDHLQLKTWSKLSILIGTAVVMFAALSPYMFTDVVKVGKSVSPVPGPLIMLYALLIVIFLPLTIVTFIKRWSVTKGLGQLQLRYVVISFTTAVLAAAMTNFIFPVLFHNSTFLEFGTAIAAIFMVIIPSYPILQQRLFGIEFVFGQFAYHFFITVFVFSDYLILLQISKRLGTTTSSTYWLSLVAFSIVSVVIFMFFSKLIYRLIDKNIIHHGLDVTEIKRRYSKAIAKSTNLDKIASNMFGFMEQTLGIRKQYIAVAKQEDSLARMEFNQHFPIKFTDEDKQFAARFWTNKEFANQPFLYQEDITDKLPPEKRDDYLLLRKLMEKYKVEVACPLFFNNYYQGIVVFGAKPQQMAFLAQDIALLKEAIGEAAPALARAILYERMNNFNDLLKAKVDEKSHDLRLAYRKLEDAYTKLQHLDKVKDDFVSVASHELRTPLTAVNGYVYMAKKQPEVKVGSKLMGFLEVIENSAGRLIKLVNDMLTISRIEAGKTEFNLQKIDLLEIAKKVHTEVASLAEQKKIYFKVETSGDEPYLVKVDNDKIHEVIMNLVGNAFKFTRKGGIKIKLSHEGKWVTLKVMDTGNGIKAEDLPKLFTKFTKLEDSYVKMQENGTGLGLSICKQMVEAQNGKVRVQSEFGKGSTFIVQLPALSQK